jgi:hypothetical protein
VFLCADDQKRPKLNTLPNGQVNHGNTTSPDGHSIKVKAIVHAPSGSQSALTTTDNGQESSLDEHHNSSADSGKSTLNLNLNFLFKVQ